jgi:hypothetical protein
LEDFFCLSNDAYGCTGFELIISLLRDKEVSNDLNLLRARFLGVLGDVMITTHAKEKRADFLKIQGVLSCSAPAIWLQPSIDEMLERLSYPECSFDNASKAGWTTACAPDPGGIPEILQQSPYAPLGHI